MIYYLTVRQVRVYAAADAYDFLSGLVYFGINFLTVCLA